MKEEKRDSLPYLPISNQVIREALDEQKLSS